MLRNNEHKKDVHMTRNTRIHNMTATDSIEKFKIVTNENKMGRCTANFDA